MDNKELDKLVHVAVINFFTLGKETRKICLCNVNVKDSRHLAGFHIAELIKNLYGYEISLSGNILNYWDIKWKCKAKKWLKRAKKKDKSSPVDMEDFISHIEKANDKPFGFSQVYEEYFRPFDRK